MKNIGKFVWAALAALGLVSPSWAAITYKTAASGNWNETATWDENGVPVNAGDETVWVKGSHCVTNAEDSLAAHTLLVGATSTTADSKLVKKGGTYTSQYLTEIGNSTVRTQPSILEIDHATAFFNDWRLVIGRQGGNARLLVRDGRIETPASLLMGIASKADAQPNVVELQNSVWTNSGDFGFGYTPYNTNRIHLVGSTLYSTRRLNMGYSSPKDNPGRFGQEFILAEAGSRIELPGTDIRMPNNFYHSAHLDVSNSYLNASTVDVGYVAGTTNYLSFADSTVETSSQILFGDAKNTVSHLLLKDMGKAKTSASALYSNLKFTSTAGERRTTDVRIVGGDWESSAALSVGTKYNDSSLAFHDLTLPVKQFTVCTEADGPARLVLSNCTCSAAKFNLYVASYAGSTGTLEVCDCSIPSWSNLSIVDTPNLSANDESVVGSVLLSGGTYAIGYISIRSGQGRLVLDRGARLDAGTLYAPNLTGSRAYYEIGGNSVMNVTEKFYVGNQGGTYSEIVVRDGGKLQVTATAINFSPSPAGFTFTISGEGSVASFAGSTPFARATGTAGTLNLNGGVFETKSFGDPAEGSSQTINFNGGVLRARESATMTQSRSKNYVDVGGAVIETSGEGQVVRFYAALQHKGEASVTDGGLTKQGPGSVYLLAANTFNGPVTVREGTLVSACTTAAALPDGVTVTLDLANGGRLSRTSVGSYPATMTIGVTNAAALDPDVDYTIAENWSDACTATVNLPKGWILRRKGTTLSTHYRGGVAIIVR